MRPIKLTISAFGPYAKETEIILDELGERGPLSDNRRYRCRKDHNFSMQSHLHFTGKRVEMKESRGCFGVNMRI